VVSALLAAVAASWLLVRRDCDGSPPQDRRPWWLLLLLVVGFFTLPLHLEKPIGWAVINPRLAVPGALVLLVCARPGRLAGWRAAVVTAPLIAVTMAYSIDVGISFRQFGERTRDFYEVVEHLPYNPRVITLVYADRDPTLDYHAWRKYASYVQVERGGYNPLLWRVPGDREGGFPMRLIAKGKPAPPRDQPLKFDWEKHATHYDYFLTRGRGKFDFSARREVELVARRGHWYLWKRKVPLDDASAPQSRQNLSAGLRSTASASPLEP
jgi:hypothetical protein